MANTIPVTQKPVPSSVSKDAYVLGIQDNGSGQQALYRLPINDVRGNGANDLFIIPSLITQLGVTNALKAFVEANADYDSLTNICNRFFTAAAKSVSGTYTSQFFKYASSNSPIGEKQDANADLTCTPSTKTVAGTDDYKTLPLFACFDVNYTIDGTTLEPVILAIKDIYGNFSSAPANSLVGVMQMTGWVRRTSTDTTKKVEYRATEATGFKPLPEAVRAADNTVRGFVVHAKYAAGYNSAGLLSSVSGVQPATYRSGSTGSTSISFNGQIAKWREWGNQYCSSSLCDIAFIQLMLEIKYATLGSAQAMAGCRNYYKSCTVAVAETNVTRVLLTPEHGEFFVVGSCVSLGSADNRAMATAYDVCDITKILSIEDITVDGTVYKAVNLDTETPFNTTTSTYIVTQPWQTGSTDDVLGNDGSLINNTSGKEPCKIQGIEIMTGAYETLGDTTLYEDAEKYTVYLNRKADDIKANSNGTNPVTVGTIAKGTSASWKYIAELNHDANNQEAYMLVQMLTNTSTVGYCSAIYLEAPTATGWRRWQSFGFLDTQGTGGLACAYLGGGFGFAYWNVATRVCGSGGNRGEFTRV